MFTRTKFKKGDIVSVLSDLSKWVEVENVFLVGGWEKCVLSNNIVEYKHNLTFYSEPIAALASELKKVRVTEPRISQLEGQLKSIQSRIDKARIEETALLAKGAQSRLDKHIAETPVKMKKK